MKTLLIILIFSIPSLAQHDRDCPAIKPVGSTTRGTIRKSMAVDSYWYTPTSYITIPTKPKPPTKKVRKHYGRRN